MGRGLEFADKRDVACHVRRNSRIAMRHERIEINPTIMNGKPVVCGTRVPVELVLRELGAGMTPEAIIAEQPRLTPDDIRATQAFAAIIRPTKTSFIAESCSGSPMNVSRPLWFESCAAPAATCFTSRKARDSDLVRRSLAVGRELRRERACRFGWARRPLDCSFAQADVPTPPPRSCSAASACRPSPAPASKIVRCSCAGL